MGVEGHSRSRKRTYDSRTVRERGLRATALVTGAGLLLTAAGCGSMPDHGNVYEVKASPQVDTQVRVYSVPPRPGDRPRAIVDGFMEAMTSDDPGFDTARKYLTRSASKAWNPGSTTTILGGAVPNPAETTSGQTGGVLEFKISGERIAELDKQSAYQPQSGVYEQTLRLVKEKGPGKKDPVEWRIDTPPAGLVLGESDFQRIFRSVNKYYFASTAGESGLRPLVADPVYVRKRTDPQTRLDPVAQAVKAVMDGPSAWLSHSVRSSFPTRAGLKAGTKTLPIGDHNSLKVPLNPEMADAERKICMDMAAQILFTLQDLTSSTRIDQVEMMRPDDSSLCTLQKSNAGDYAPGGFVGPPNHEYFLNGDRHLVRILSASENALSEPVPGAIGERRTVVRSAGVSRGEKTVAAVLDSGHELSVAPIAPLASGAADAKIVYRSERGAKETLSAPSWDGMGDLWFADRDQRRPRVMRLVDGGGTPQQVSIERLDEGYVDSLRVSADGVRVALLVVGKDQRKTLKIGRVERSNGPGGPEVSIVGLRPAAPQMEDVTAMSWAGQSRLVVAGRETGGVQQMRYVRTDGSSSAEGLLPGANQVTAVAASDAEGSAVLAQTKDDGIVRLPPGANWKTLAKPGSMPVYPG
ncbi:lipoprotein LpqB [Streptomyces spiroverticillatus]|uniref:Lipoprotein LpqB n=1 Tax=Streptomyces finlayi TaxID=67296 RepID=A0A918WYH8_9ACTN|nr:LpqB family beta-propeller domain-containing protein [Streptomyces finlayi]GHA09599.1 lipoprotein LpqB [Streptomyces spiroverticillatus]GHC96212.1 lipoprotein LpqB [Streptomyces finlayi]